MKTVMPRKVKVGPHVYSILRKPASELQGLGLCDFYSLQISVRRRLRKSKAQEILVHELLHACTHPSLNGENEKFEDEQFVEATAPILLQTLQDNPDLVEYLTQ